MSRARTYFRAGLRGMLIIRMTESAPDIAVRKQIERYFSFFIFPSYSLVLCIYHSRSYEIQIHIISHITNNTYSKRIKIERRNTVATEEDSFYLTVYRKTNERFLRTCITKCFVRSVIR